MQNMLVTFSVDPHLIYGGTEEPAVLVNLQYASGGKLQKSLYSAACAAASMQHLLGNSSSATASLQ